MGLWPFSGVTGALAVVLTGPLKKDSGLRLSLVVGLLGDSILARGDVLLIAPVVETEISRTAVGMKCLVCCAH